MKNSHSCPKCHSSEIAKIPGGFSQSQSYLTIGFSTVYMDRYVCTHCGFLEIWIRNEKDLDKIAKKYKKNDDYDRFV